MKNESGGYWESEHVVNALHTFSSGDDLWFRCDTERDVSIHTKQTTWKIQQGIRCFGLFMTKKNIEEREFVIEKFWFNLSLNPLIEQTVSFCLRVSAFWHMVAPPSYVQPVFWLLTSSSWLWTCWTIRSMATMFPPPRREKQGELDDVGVCVLV